MNPALIAIITAAGQELSGPLATAFVKWTAGFIQALPAIETGAADAKQWLSAGLSLFTEGDTPTSELDALLASLKTQAAATDAQVATDAKS